VEVTQVCGQQGKPQRRVGVLAIRVDDGADGKAVTKVVYPRSAVLGPWLESGSTDKAREVPLHVAVQESGAGCGDEKAWSGGAWIELIAFL